MIKFEGQIFHPAHIEDGVDVFRNPNFIIVKRSWQPDNAAQFCPICNCRFGGLKRRHHCRQCGLVVCNKCCHEKVPLPQLAIDEQEKVCDSCLPITRLVTLSRSPDQMNQLNAVQELASLCRDVQNIPQIFGIGGYHTLLAMGRSKNIKVIEHVLAGLHTLSMFDPLHEVMVAAGHISVICEILRQEDMWMDQILLDGISALMIFCKSNNYIVKVLEAGFLHTVLKLCTNRSETVAMVSVSMLSQLMTQPGTHEPIIDGNRQALQSLLSLTASDNEQMQAVTLKCLTFLSLDSDWNKHRILQEDFTAGRPLKTALKRQTENMQVLVNAVCLVANLATSPDDQRSLDDCRDCLLDIFMSDISNLDLIIHVARGIANFCKFPENFNKMISMLPVILNKAVGHENQGVVRHGLRAVFNLLCSQPEQTTQELVKNGPEPMLQQLSRNEEVMTAIFSILLKQHPDVAKPLWR